MKLECSVTRTHRQGERLKDREWDQPVIGIVRMQTAFIQTLNREVPMMTMDSLETFGKSRRGAIPDLLEPRLLTFCSDRGMMVVGFEEICGRRYYQGWWIRWDFTGTTA
ncbi:hypothetical protein [Bordetella bronchiseptica]|uniref:Uncharacterized protein n=1 Tax=Bordetella bronchiseptica (strain ATCC BAA-588 / NCTC 13252 / RB50) TaxID=257310 RepID=A0A0H3LKD6_BORBR|nr:hypothetical protein [Bordetella bronchiseptica]KAK69113.1 hypothetical protein AZ22_1656 [Bordetella bronchiseptica 980-2]KCV26781.1 hypothetical protein L489_1902 [Bordetella bronchiseptica 00-P-2730]KDD52224.1 hypothetical protein L533_1806 [Bordetella bronchiseptica OSU553]KCV53133.1 hypothetical protein L491_1754 [Bordetella bronchiseptica 3E44]KCV59687.1 hypothetical protein AZ14_1730 [Bordetella bronchiseptica 980]